MPLLLTQDVIRSPALRHDWRSDRRARRFGRVRAVRHWYFSIDEEEASRLAVIAPEQADFRRSSALCANHDAWMASPARNNGLRWLLDRLDP